MSEFYNFTSFNTDKLCVLKFDHFENIHRLDKKLPVFDGAPNFRQVTELTTSLPVKNSFQRHIKNFQH